jgi:hypothetical protein
MQLSRQPYVGIQSSAKWTARRRVFYVTLWFLSCTALWTHHHCCPLVRGRPLFIALVGYKTYLKSALLWWHILSTRLRTLSGHLMKVQWRRHQMLKCWNQKLLEAPHRINWVKQYGHWVTDFGQFHKQFAAAPSVSIITHFCNRQPVLEFCLPPSTRSLPIFLCPLDQIPL